MKFRYLSALLLSFVMIGCSSFQNGVRTPLRSVSPYDFGLAVAKTGIERYEVLLKTHRAAVESSQSVDYRGINSIEIEIPDNAASIPLTAINDFQGCTLIVKNRKKTIYLFGSQEKAKSVNVSKRDIDLGIFNKYPEIARGQCILLIEDGNPWIENRKGFDYGHKRKDILLLKEGIAQNRVVMPYNNDESVPVCRYIKLSNPSVIVKNLTVLRAENCTEITNIFFITGKSEVQLSNIKIVTPENNWRNDRAIRIDDCTNVHLENVTIDRTYSQEKHSGYGISMNNIWNFSANRLIASGNWGVFGTNNINNVYIENSEINRFDIHCYGKDVSFSNVSFHDRYNQLGSVFGNVIFNGCSFTNFVPVLNGGTYNAYVKHDVIFNDCTFNVTAGQNCLLKMGSLDNIINTRKELREKCWPDIYIKNMTINMDDSCSDFILVYSKIVGDVSKSKIHNFSTIDIDGMKINSAHDNIRFYITPKPVLTSNQINCTFKNVLVNGDPIETKQSVRVLSNIPLKAGKIRFVKSLNNK